MPTYRNKKVTFTNEQRKHYQQAKQEVEQGKQAIIAEARRTKAQMEMLRHVLQQLKAERERQGLSLADISTRSGLDKAALSRLENAANANPKLETLTRYADALRVELTISIRPSKAA